MDLRFLLLASFIIILVAVAIQAEERKRRLYAFLEGFAKQNDLTILNTEGSVRVLGTLGSRSITIETFEGYRIGRRYPVRVIRTFLSTNVPGHVYLKLEGRTFLFYGWDPQQESAPALDLLFESECHPPDFLERLAGVDSLLAYKLGNVFKHSAGSGQITLELKAGQISFEHQQPFRTLEQFETAVNAVDRFAAAAERAV